MDRFIKLLISAGIVLSSLTLVMAQDQEKAAPVKKDDAKAEIMKAPTKADNPKTLEKVKKESTTTPAAKPAEKKTKKEAMAAEKKKSPAKDEKKGFFRRLFGGGGSDE
ncbi:MAG: hypothetical protein ACE5D2_08100 [Fidelibacterota bacterium]